MISIHFHPLCWLFWNEGIVCKQIYREYEKLYYQKQNLDHLVNRFKNEHEDYIEIEYVAEEKVKNLLTDRRILLEFALVAVIEAVRRDPQIYLLIDKMPTAKFNYDSLSLINMRQSSFPQNYVYNYPQVAKGKALELADRFYNKLVKCLVDDTISTANSTSSFFQPLQYSYGVTDLSNQSNRDMKDACGTYEIHKGNIAE